MSVPCGAFSVRMPLRVCLVALALLVSGPAFAGAPSPPSPEVDAITKKLGELRSQKADFEAPTTDLVHQLAGIATTPAIRVLVRVAGDHGGAMKPEVSKTLKDLGDHAVPALIVESRRDPSPDLRKFAQTQLEGMGKRIAGDAVQTPDNAVLAEVLHSFAEVHDLDALPVLLSFVGSDRVVVRDAARDAIGDFGADAIWKLREAYTNVLNHPAPDNATAPQVAKALFGAYDRLRLQEVYGLLETGLAAAHDGHAEDAVAAFDKVLARQPMLDRRGEMVPAYVQVATSLEESDPPRSLALFHEAERLWPEGPRASLIAGEIAYLEGKNLEARGITDPEPFRRALAADPTHIKARDELTRIDGAADEHKGRIRNFAAAGAAVVVAMIGLILFGGRRRPRTPRIPRMPTV